MKSVEAVFIAIVVLYAWTQFVVVYPIVTFCDHLLSLSSWYSSIVHHHADVTDEGVQRGSKGDSEVHQRGIVGELKGF
jgi:hypothetical protein